MGLGMSNSLGIALLLAHMAYASPQASVAKSTTQSSASEIVVTATTGKHPVVTFMPSQNPNYTSITTTATTTNQYNQTIVVLPFGIIWAPIPPVPPIPPEPPIDTIPEVPKQDGEGDQCKSWSMSECTKTVSYTSETTGWTSSITGQCNLPTSTCVIPFGETTTTVQPPTVPWAEITSVPTGYIPEPQEVDQDTADFFSRLYKKLGIERNAGIPDPKCQRSKLFAPQRPDDGSPDVLTTLEKWCDKMDGVTVVKAPDGIDTVFNRFSYSMYSFWLSANTWYASPFGCGDESTISAKECKDTLNEAMITCDPDSGKTHGASMDGTCIQYNITLSYSINDQSPPWNPISSPQCEGSTSGVDYTFFEALAPVFCKVADNNDDSHFSQVLTNNDLPTDEDLGQGELKKRTPPASPNEYNGYKFHFDWNARDNGGSCRVSCQEAYRRVMEQCGGSGGLQNAMTHQGSMDAGCGVYSYSIQVPPPKPSPTYTTVKATAPTAPVACYLERPDCSNADADPDTAHDKTDTFCDDHEDYSGFRGWAGITDSSKDFLQSIGWYFKVEWKKDCVDLGGTYMNLGQPIPSFSCKDAMRMTFDGCTNNGGRGGKVEVGCMEYYFNPTNRASFGQPVGKCITPWGPFEK